MDVAGVVDAIALAAIVSPALLLGLLGLSGLLGYQLGERAIARSTQTAVWVGLLACGIVLAFMLTTGVRRVVLDLGHWFAIPEEGLHFHLEFVFDRLSVPFAVLTFVLCGVVGAFTSRYLHREAGYGRFYLCYAIFLLGMVLSALAGTIETLFFGWELVGLSSALLVAFFQERPGPVHNGLRVWGIYRVADAAFLIAALVLHNLTGAGDFVALAGADPWPYAASSIDQTHALIVGLLLLVAAAGKSALVPFSGWLPRAMEGPTPSSAIFYGALSVHLGAYLLLRAAPIIEASVALQVAVVCLGLASAAFGSMTARVQTDIKSALAYASLTQVGIIVAEIGLGFRYLPLVHIIGHASLRTLQLVRAPSLLHDYHMLENAIGERLQGRAPVFERLAARIGATRLYRTSLERGHFDTLLDEFLVRPFLAFFARCDRIERRMVEWGERPAAPNRGSDRGSERAGEPRVEVAPR